MSITTRDEYEAALEWREAGKIAIQNHKDALKEFEQWEKDIVLERKKRQKTIEELGKKASTYRDQREISRRKAIIKGWKRQTQTEEYTMKKMEYAVNCLEALKESLIEDYNTKTGLYECQVGDGFSQKINHLGWFLEGNPEDGEQLDVSEPGVFYDETVPLARYDNGPGKYIHMVDGVVKAVDFPTIFDLRKQGFTLDDIIGLAHMQFIGKFEESRVYFTYVDEVRDNYREIWRESYEGVLAEHIPEFCWNNQHEIFFFSSKASQENPELKKKIGEWRFNILDEKPAKMYIKEHCEMVSCMNDILVDGRLYQNPFGITFDSSPEQIYWDYDPVADDSVC